MKIFLVLFALFTLSGCSANPEVIISKTPSDMAKCSNLGIIKLEAKSEVEFIHLAKKELLRLEGNHLYIMPVKLENKRDNKYSYVAYASKCK